MVLLCICLSNVNSYKLSSLSKLRLNQNIVNNINNNNKSSKLQSVCGCINNVMSSPSKAGQLFSSMSSCKKVITLAPLAAIIALFIM